MHVEPYPARKILIVKKHRLSRVNFFLLPAVIDRREFIFEINNSKNSMDILKN
jgi:hypothetical protein